MGICYQNDDLKNQKYKSGPKTRSLNEISYKYEDIRINYPHTSTGENYAMGFIDLRSSLEKKAEKFSSEPLPTPFEDYAQEILSLFEKGLEYNTLQTELRKIGEKMNDNNKQMYVAYRANYLCKQACSNGNKNCEKFSLRTLELAWDGLGGWMK